VAGELGSIQSIGKPARNSVDAAVGRPFDRFYRQNRTLTMCTQKAAAARGDNRGGQCRWVRKAGARPLSTV
jgi:hypothetical protein